MKLTPFLIFDGTCGEAMKFYQSCFGGELVITRVGETPMKAQAPPEQHRKVINARLKSGPIDITATDWLHQTRVPKQGNLVCLYLSEASYEELSTAFGKLSEGADPALLDPLREMPFGTYGHLADRFQVHWMFQGERKP